MPPCVLAQICPYEPIPQIEEKLLLTGKLEEVEFLKTGFLQKGYTVNDLNRAITDVALRERDDLLKPKKRDEGGEFFSCFSFFTNYSNQDFFIKKIFRKHSDVLKNHRILGLLL